MLMARRSRITSSQRRGHSHGHQDTHRDNREPSSSSSSDTIEGNETLPELIKENERRPLLPPKNSTPRVNLLQRTTRALRSLGMYQPRALPIIEKTLPANSTTLLIVLLLGLNVFYAVYNIHWEIKLAFIVSDRTAALFVANLPWLYVLAAKNQPLKLLTGYSYENLNILHRRLGEILCLLAVFHGAGMLVTWYRVLRPAGLPLWNFLTHRIIVLGIAAFVCYELLYLTSLASFRQWWYEVFLGSHIVLQAAGLALIYFHHPGGRVYAATALAIFVVDRLVFRLAIKSRSVQADLTVMEDGNTVLVSAAWPTKSRWLRYRTSLLGAGMAYGWNAAEHVFLTVPALARKHIIQAHPFTIASAAPQGGNQHAWFNLIIRAHDGFTQDLVRFAGNHASATVRLDGPYGSLRTSEMLRASDVALLVVGGSGIAVAYPLLWSLLHQNDAEAATTPSRKVGLIWVVHETSHLSWIGQERLDELEEKGLRVCIPTPTSKAGRPDVGLLIRRSLDEMIGTGDDQDPKVGVVVSGPDSMNRTARNTCATFAWHGMDIKVAVEKYGW
ncbi:hypothetical protein LTR08_005204 [Meristemomyces frigidus]|nr:hypothetical protein LTR08_005204 [Meristemomyces frigidus]